MTFDTYTVYCVTKRLFDMAARPALFNDRMPPARVHARLNRVLRWEAQKDTQRAIAAAKAIFDGRDPAVDMDKILVTLEGAVALVLLAVMKNDHRNAAAMLNEGVVPGVEGRIALAAARRAPA